jgi:hypothetical protein
LVLRESRLFKSEAIGKVLSNSSWAMEAYDTTGADNPLEYRFLRLKSHACMEHHPAASADHGREMAQVNHRKSWNSH